MLSFGETFYYLCILLRGSEGQYGKRMTLTALRVIRAPGRRQLPPIGKDIAQICESRS